MNQSGGTMARQTRPLAVAASMLGLAGAAIWLWSGASSGRMNAVALVLVALNGILAFLPVWAQMRAGRVDAFHPLIYANITFMLPMTVVYGWYLAAGGEPQLLGETSDAGWYLNMTLACVGVGWGSMLLGYYAPVGSFLARRLRVPRALTGERRGRWPAPVATLCVGLLAVAVLVVEGAYGAGLGVFEGNLVRVSIARTFTPWIHMSLFLLIFCTARYRGGAAWRVSAILAFAVALGLASVTGSRAGVAFVLVYAAAAQWYGHYPRMIWRRLALWYLAIMTAGFMSVLVVSQYREMRQLTAGEENLSFMESARLLAAAASDMSRLDLGSQVEMVRDRLLDRVGVIELLGITLAYARTLEAAEREAGIDNNIAKDVLWSLVPRPLWPDKPVVGDFGLLFSQVYLNSPYRVWTAPTVFGDLYRNFGIVGVPVGMLLVGMYFRLLYERFVVTNQGNALAALFYLSLVSAMNWEGNYSSFIIGGSRVLVSLLLLVVGLRLCGGTRGVVGEEGFSGSAETARPYPQSSVRL